MLIFFGKNWQLVSDLRRRAVVSDDQTGALKNISACPDVVRNVGAYGTYANANFATIV